jgi:hypothetical protein
MKSRLDRMAMKCMKAGETGPMADGTSRALEPDDVRSGRDVIWPVGSTDATALAEIGGHWNVVARPLIAARKAEEVKRPPPGPASPRPRL